MSVTEDTLRSLAISQRLLGTREIVLVHHTDCAMLTFEDDSFRKGIEQETGIRPTWAAEAFTDVEADVRQSIKRIEASPFVPHIDQIRGFVFDVATGAVNEVNAAYVSLPGAHVLRVILVFERTQPEHQDDGRIRVADDGLKQWRAEGSIPQPRCRHHDRPHGRSGAVGRELRRKRPPGVRLPEDFACMFRPLNGPSQSE